jgi:serine/threonine-protein kinase
MAILERGTVVLGYVIDRLLGQGGMGTVYLARQQSLNRPVALKILHPHLLRQPGAVDDFLREARASARLDHPHLVVCHDVQADPARSLYCYSMEYLQGRTVTEMMRADGVLRRATALHITYQIAGALAHAHRHLLVHRDVKPDNILVTGGSLAKLLDLGLVHDRVGAAAGSAGGRRLVVVGTPEFSAPEQSRNPQHATGASDVYALGATLYYMLTGSPPHGGDTVIDLIVRAATEPVAYPPTIPDDCRALLELMLVADPEMRLSDGAAVVAVLEGMAKGIAPRLDNGPIGGGEDDEDSGAVPIPGSPHRPRPRRRRRYRAG